MFETGPAPHTGLCNASESSSFVELCVIHAVITASPTSIPCPQPRPRPPRCCVFGVAQTPNSAPRPAFPEIATQATLASPAQLRPSLLGILRLCISRTTTTAASRGSLVHIFLPLADFPASARGIIRSGLVRPCPDDISTDWPRPLLASLPLRTASDSKLASERARTC